MGLKVMLDSQSNTESVNYDFLEVYYKKNNQYFLVGKYGGSIAGKEILIPTFDFYIRWKSDASNTKYGFKISSIIQCDNIAESSIVYTPQSIIPIEKNESDYPETSHPYKDNENIVWHYTFEDMSYCDFPIYYGAKIGEKHTVDDWNLQCIDVEIGAPSAKVKQITVPGRNGLLDLTSSLTGSDTPKYDNRVVRLTFVLIDKSITRWSTVDSAIKNYCHGKTMDVVLDSDPGWYWRGRCTVTTTKEDAVYSKFVIEMDAEPFKYDINSSDSDWIWDTLNFETGVIREYRNISVSGSKTITVIGTAIESIPTITVSVAMILKFNNVTYNLKAGANKISDILIKDGENKLLFTGTGTVTISYKGVSL